MTTSTPFSWRSMLFVPATSDRFLESALKRPTDAIQLDLEDSVAPDLKDASANSQTGLRLRATMSSCVLIAPGA